MRIQRLLVIAALALFVPSVALANSVTVKNKDGKKVVLVVKRARSSMDVDILARSTMELPGAPMKLTNKKTGEAIEALSGETVVIEKGKLTKLEPEPEEGAEYAPPVEPTEPSEPPPSEPVDPPAGASPTPLAE